MTWKWSQHDVILVAAGCWFIYKQFDVTNNLHHRYHGAGSTQEFCRRGTGRGLFWILSRAFLDERVLKKKQTDFSSYPPDQRCHPRPLPRLPEQRSKDPRLCTESPSALCSGTRVFGLVNSQTNRLQTRARLPTDPERHSRGPFVVRIPETWSQVGVKCTVSTPCTACPGQGSLGMGDGRRHWGAYIFALKQCCCAIFQLHRVIWLFALHAAEAWESLIGIYLWLLSDPVCACVTFFPALKLRLVSGSSCRSSDILSQHLGLCTAQRHCFKRGTINIQDLYVFSATKLL